MSVSVVTPERPTLRIVTATPKRPKLFVDRLIEAGCEVIAMAGQATVAIVKSRQHDRAHDHHLDRVVQLGEDGARDADHQRCGHGPRFRAIVREAVAAQVQDASEDGLIDKAVTVLARIADICRAANRSLESEGRKRGWWR